MFVEHLEAQGFRNLGPLTLNLSPRAIVVRGPNAQGKTNLLEALYVCATGRSFRNATARELLAHGTERGRIVARLVRHGVRHEVEVTLAPQHKGMHVDGRALRHAAKLLELVNVVAFFPDDLRIAKGSPEERRRFVDRAIANHRPDFVEAALGYAKVLKSRNALLRAKEAPDKLLLETYDDELVRLGSVVQACRVETLGVLGPLAQAHFDRIMGTHEALRFSLTGGVLGDENAAYGERFRLALRESYPRDRARGMTSSGPHRADLLVFVADRDARLFASQGQQRAVVLALKLAELEYLKGRLGVTPVLLLDDVSSELDTERTRLLFETVATQGGQVWVSTTGAAPLPLPAEAQVFEVRGGVVRPV